MPPLEITILTAEEPMRLWEPHQVQVQVVCLNCDTSFTARGARMAAYLFCSEYCTQVAKNVRWARRYVRLFDIDGPDIGEVLRMRQACVLSVGGYPELARCHPQYARRS